MGTRSITTVKDKEGNALVNMYRQFDGYPSGHGLELAVFLEGKVIVNGIADREKEDFNGYGCLAASLVSYFKKDIGDFYLVPVDSDTDCICYEYIVYGEIGQEPIIEVWSYREKIFQGHVSQFKTWCEKQED